MKVTERQLEGAYDIYKVLTMKRGQPCSSFEVFKGKARDVMLSQDRNIIITLDELKQCSECHKEFKEGEQTIINHSTGENFHPECY